MVDLVLDAHGQQAVGVQLERLAVGVQGFDPDFDRALDAVVNARYRQAAFVVDLLFRAGPDDGRVDEDAQLVLGLGGIDNEQLLVHVYLAGGQPDAGGVVHGLGHVGHQFVDAFAKFGDRNGNLVQTRIRVAENIQDGHSIN